MLPCDFYQHCFFPGLWIHGGSEPWCSANNSEKPWMCFWMTVIGDVILLSKAHHWQKHRERETSIGGKIISKFFINTCLLLWKGNAVWKSGSWAWILQRKKDAVWKWHSEGGARCDQEPAFATQACRQTVASSTGKSPVSTIAASQHLQVNASN